MRFNLKWLFVLLAFCLLSNFAWAEEITQKFEHSLGIGTSSKSYEHKIDLPDALAAQGLRFVKRNLTLSGKLVIEREELTATYYYVKVRLLKAWLSTAKGALNVTLVAEKSQFNPPVLPPCSSLQAREPAEAPYFSWNGQGKYTAITLMERDSGKTVWERVILGKCNCKLDEGTLSIGRRYVWAVKQADEYARYSDESRAYFKIGAKYEQCRHCFGTGWERCSSCGGSGYVIVTGPNNTPVSQPCSLCHGSGRVRCTWCNGTGYVQIPIIINE